ncbi:hypothetical protein K437DRAFT_268046 [Tilletiaria anomala UBC 951]|uniref:non-specific serine/threonine protein kinase n=1 Tax=Tilletiaria anomala (strain ATCC 24038 / CBS 436.72 / UBC 951) TaxID=1037660 RepID=A0A066VYM8_TILAU|nr:uncharacterized protein K437DRAFT_268046 [Tilletiaria anomala UBC 951]KDN46606.1 hypothetical protein K437DRAFT_268046 [Tilletiaria anomala UBC 951]
MEHDGVAVARSAALHAGASKGMQRPTSPSSSSPVSSSSSSSAASGAATLLAADSAAISARKRAAKSACPAHSGGACHSSRGMLEHVPPDRHARARSITSPAPLLHLPAAATPAGKAHDANAHAAGRGYAPLERGADSFAMLASVSANGTRSGAARLTPMPASGSIPSSPAAVAPGTATTALRSTDLRIHSNASTPRNASARSRTRSSSTARQQPHQQQQQQQTQHTASASTTPPLSAAEQARKREREKERETARAAEREAWERTRGAGSSVLDLLGVDDWHARQLAASWQRKHRTRTGMQMRTAAEDAPANGNAIHHEQDPATAADTLDAQGAEQALHRGGSECATSSSSCCSSSSATSDEWTAEDVLPSLEVVQSRRFEPLQVPSADLLLSRGISEYTVLPRILGRGKFSTVFLAVKNGKRYAIKHTPLFPHHHLISTRLLREPTLLAELPPHPNLVAVNETIRTPGHFYLVEEYLGGYVTLEALLPMMSQTQPPQQPQLPIDVADKVLTQLLSAVHAIHHPLQICHRDIKPENILVHPATMQLKLLDFGLATHFSKSEPKLSTCCGSPAFHCPEIVHALASPPGAVQYWGPEVDAWTCGITMVRVLTGIRYPLGASHASLRSMAIRAQRAVAMIHDVRMREKVSMLLEMDGVKRMRYFTQLVSDQQSVLEEQHRGVKEFKSTTFIPTEPAHTMHLRLLTRSATEAIASTPGFAKSMTGFHSNLATPVGSRAPSPTRLASAASSSTAAPSLILLNTSGHPPQRLLSFIKYCLRCAGVLYHCWADTSAANMSALLSHALHEIVSTGTGSFSVPGTPAVELPPSPTTPMFPIMGERADGWGHVYVFECVMELVERKDEEQESQSSMSLVQTIMAAFGRRTSDMNTKRSSSTPARNNGSAGAQAGAAKGAKGKPSPGPSGNKGAINCLTFYLVIRFPRSPSAHAALSARPGYSRSSSAYGSRRSRASSVAGTEVCKMPTASRALFQEPAVENNTLRLKPTVPAPGTETERVSTTLSNEKGEGHTPKAASPGPLQNPLQIVTSPDGLLNLIAINASRSPPCSRNSSRTRTRGSSNAAHMPISNKRSSHKGRVYIQVSDERAVEVVKNALSRGGVQEPSDVEDDAATDGNDTDSSRRSFTHQRQSMLRSRSHAPLTRSRRPSRGAAASETAAAEITATRGRQPWRKGHEEVRQDLSSVAAVKEESPSSFDLETMVNDCGTHLEKVIDPSGRAIEATDAQTATQALTAARGILVTMSKTFSALEQADPERLKSILSPWTFNLFSAVAPSLGINAEGLLSSEGTTPPVQGSAIRFLGADVLQVAARNLSPREVFVAVQECMELMLAGSSKREKGQEEQQAEAEDAEDSSREPLAAPVWTGALELSGLLNVLNTVLPRLQSKKPHKFTETLTETVPRAVRHLMAKLAADSDLSASRQQEPRSSHVHHSSSSPSTWTEPQSPLKMTAVRELCEGLCALTETLIGWEAAMLSAAGSTTPAPQTNGGASERVLALFLGGFTSLLPSLPLINGSEASLAELHFKSREPKYTFHRPATTPFSVPTAPLSASIMSLSSDRTVLQGDAQGPGQLWIRISEVTKSLRTNLIELAFEHHAAAEEASSPSATMQGTISLGSFLLLAQLLARNLHNDSLGIRSPGEWTPSEAEQMLEKALPTLMAGLGAKMPPMLTASGTASSGRASALSDGALLWLMWCFEGLRRDTERLEPLEENVSLPLVQLLALHAALSSAPSSRHISIRMLRDLLVDLMEEPLALDQIKDLIFETSYPPLKAACVGLLKDVLDQKASSDSLFWNPVALTEVLPAFLNATGIPKPDTSSEGEFKTSYDGALNALEEKTSWISEVSHFFFYLLRRDVENKTGIKDTVTLQRLREDFADPLCELLASWEAALDDETNSSMVSPRRGQGDDIRVPLNIIRLALDRLFDELPRRE